MRMEKASYKRHEKVHAVHRRPTPIVTKGAFSLVWVNPNPNPVDLHPEEEDWDPQDQFDPVTGQVIGHFDD